MIDHKRMPNDDIIELTVYTIDIETENIIKMYIEEIQASDHHVEALMVEGHSYS